MIVSDLETKSTDELVALDREFTTASQHITQILAARAGGAAAAAPMVPVQIPLLDDEPEEERIFDRQEKLKDGSLRYVTRKEGTAIYGLSEDTLTRLIKKNPKAGFRWGATLYIDRKEFRPRKIEQ